jgi:hypothetical protein
VLEFVVIEEIEREVKFSTLGIGDYGAIDAEGPVGEADRVNVAAVI